MIIQTINYFESFDTFHQSKKPVQTICITGEIPYRPPLFILYRFCAQNCIRT